MTFYLRTKKEEGTANLYFLIQRKAFKWQVNSNIEVDVRKWRTAQKNSVCMAEYMATEEGMQVANRMKQINALVGRMMKDKELKENGDLGKLMFRLETLQYAEIAEQEQHAEEVISEQEKEQQGRILTFFDSFLDGMESGTRLKDEDGNPYRPESIRNYQNTRKRVSEYMKQTGTEDLTFNELSKEWVNGFITYCRKNNWMAKTINKHKGCLRHLCNLATEEGICSNPAAIKIWKERTVKDHDKVTEIALTENELDALYNLPLDGIREQVRDVWFLGMMIAQRQSDYTRLSADNFKVTAKGTPVILLQQVKTGNDVIIPIIDNRINEIAEKYNYNFPHPDKRTLNRYIKECARLLAESVESMREWIRTPITAAQKNMEQQYKKWLKYTRNGGKLRGEDAKRFRDMMQYAKEHQAVDGELYRRDYSGFVVRMKWELVTSHTARRSGITSLYNTGIFDKRELMSLSGHASEKRFEGYIRRTSVDTAERIAAKAQMFMNRKEQEETTNHIKTAL
ncbi:MAG: site-specific integrase [Bacteroidaceae bacterium]|nr:site-specific integrase [Bacteroidaceae bacterium]